MSTDHTVVELPLEQLHESPFNYRKAFNDADLQELAVNILAEGRVHQPILVRPVNLRPLLGEADTFQDYEIVFGHRRFRAAQLANLATIPCMVRAMSDIEAKRAQIAENLQRVDVHPIEEAEGFQALIDDGADAEDLAVQAGKSKSFVYGRLKLLQACPEVRKACLAGEIGSEVALLVARLRTPKLQEKALQAIKAHNCDIEDGGAKSFRRIRDLLNEKFTLKLKDALFDIEDEMLLPEAGHCLRCPKRAGNAPEFSDVAAAADRKNPMHPDYLHGEANTSFGYGTNVGADVCTDPDCFDAKKKAHLKRQAEALAAKGKTVIDGNKARQAVDAHGNVKGGYVALKDVREALKKANVKADTVAIQDPRSGKVIEAVAVDQVKKAGVKVKEAAARPNYEEDRRKREAEHEKAEAAARLETAIRLAVLEQIRNRIRATERSAFDLQLIAPIIFSAVSWNAKPLLANLYNAKASEDLAKRVGQFDAANLTLFILDCVLIGDVQAAAYDYKDKPKQLLAVARHYEVDAERIRAEMTGKLATPSTAARAQGKGAGKAKKAKGQLKLADDGAPDEPELAGDDQMNDAGYAGGSTGQVDALEETDA
jgi:ParB/RepB/Spo0J family partition protein